MTMIPKLEEWHRIAMQIYGPDALDIHHGLDRAQTALRETCERIEALDVAADQLRKRLEAAEECAELAESRLAIAVTGLRRCLEEGGRWDRWDMSMVANIARACIADIKERAK